MKKSGNADLDLKRKLFNDVDIEISHVFYEATFMRDYFERDRRISSLDNPSEEAMKAIINKKKPKCVGKKWADERRFNRWLLKYVEEDTKKKRFKYKSEDFVGEIQDYHLGAKKGQQALTKYLKEEFMEDTKDRIRVLMNSKPDIAVIYKKGETTYLQFFECKFESNESDNNTKISQTKAQDLIAYFLTQYEAGRNPYHIADTFVHTKIVRFEREDKQDETEIHINIKELCS